MPFSAEGTVDDIGALTVRLKLHLFKSKSRTEFSAACEALPNLKRICETSSRQSLAQRRRVEQAPRVVSCISGEREVTRIEFRR